MQQLLRPSVLFPVLLVSASVAVGADTFGLFENHGDIGAPLRAGSVEHDTARGTYTVAGGGVNMWFTNDAFQFVWKKVSGDVTLAADIAFLGAGGDPHRKACLLVRQSLEPDSAYADAVLHGDGLNSLQYRETKGARGRKRRTGFRKCARPWSHGIGASLIHRHAARRRHRRTPVRGSGG